MADFENTTTIALLLAGFGIIGIGLLIAWSLLRPNYGGIVFERDDRGRITAIYQVPAVAKT